MEERKKAELMKISAVKMPKLRMLPSLKERSRYVVFECEQPDFDRVKSGVLSGFNRLFGVSGAGGAGIQFLDDWSSCREGCRGIVRVDNKHVDNLRASFALSDFFVRSVGVSGTLRKAREKYFGRDYMISTSIRRRACRSQMKCKLGAGANKSKNGGRI